MVFFYVFIVVVVLFFFLNKPFFSCWLSSFRQFTASISQSADPPYLFWKDAGLIQSLTGMNILIVVLGGGEGVLAARLAIFGCQENPGGVSSLEVAPETKSAGGFCFNFL